MFVAFQCLPVSAASDAFQAWSVSFLNHLATLNPMQECTTGVSMPSGMLKMRRCIVIMNSAVEDTCTTGVLLGRRSPPCTSATAILNDTHIVSRTTDTVSGVWMSDSSSLSASKCSILPAAPNSSLFPILIDQSRSNYSTGAINLVRASTSFDTFVAVTALRLLVSSTRVVPRF